MIRNVLKETETDMGQNNNLLQMHICNDLVKHPHAALPDFPGFPKDGTRHVLTSTHPHCTESVGGVEEWGLGGVGHLELPAPGAW